MMQRIWTEETVIRAIRDEALAGHELSYMRTEKRVPSLLRAAQRTFGSWGAAVKAAGFDYDEIRRYRVWTRESVVKAILEWHKKGADLSWRNISIVLDPPLAAAALHAERFSSWSEALKAAGLEPKNISRYRKWKASDMRQELLDLALEGIPLSRKSLSAKSPALLAAVYRVGGGLVKERSTIPNQPASLQDR